MLSLRSAFVEVELVSRDDHISHAVYVTISLMSSSVPHIITKDRLSSLKCILGSHSKIEVLVEIPGV